MDDSTQFAGYGLPARYNIVVEKKQSVRSDAGSLFLDCLPAAPLPRDDSDAVPPPTILATYNNL